MFKKILVGVVSSAIIMSGFPVASAAPLGSSKSRSTSTSSSSSGKTGSSFNRAPASSSQSAAAQSGTNRGVLGGTSMGRQSTVLQDRLRTGDRSGPANNTTVAGNNRGNTNNTNNTNNGNYAGNSNQNGNYNNGGYNNNNNGYNNNQPRQGHSTGALIGAAAAGAIGGYMLNGIMHNRDGSVYNGSGYSNGVPVQGGNVGAAPVAYADGNGGYSNGNGYNGGAPVIVQKSGTSFWWSLLGFLLVLAFIFAAYKYFTRNKSSQGADMFNSFGSSAPAAPSFNEPSPEDKIRDNKEKIFTQLQTNFKPSGLDLYRQYATPDFFENSLKDAVLDTNDNRTIKVRSLQASLVAITQEGTNYIASVVYDYVIVEQEAGKDAEEYSGSQGWTFIHPVNGYGDWKLDGITVKS